VEPLVKELEAWCRVAERSDLFSVDLEGRLLVWDLRPMSREPLTVLSGIDRILYQSCDGVCDLRQLAEVAAREAGQTLPLEEVARRLEELSARGLLLQDGARCLALALPLGEYAPRPAATERFRELTRRLGRRSSEGLVVPLNGAAPLDGRRKGRTSRRARSARSSRPRRARFAVSPSWFRFRETGELLIRPGSR
jgi:hypothetical protein